jgi:hypothetical protein
MSFSPLSMARRHVLGDLYLRCDRLVDDVPVFVVSSVEGEAPNLVGHVNQSLGTYADAFTFHLPDDVCKLLAGGHYSYSFEYEFADTAARTSRSRICLSSVSLIARQNYAKPLPRSRPAQA